MKKKNIRGIRLIVSIGSFMGLVAINYTILHNPIALLLATILLIHELGHYYIGKYYGSTVSYPVFIPLFLFSIGMTKVKNIPYKDKPAVALAGPAFAVSTILLVIILNTVFTLYSNLVLALILGREMVMNFIGSDGKYYRKVVIDNRLNHIS